MRYVLDTNVLLYYVRDQKTRQYIDEHFDPFGSDNDAIISVVSLGEIYSLATRNRWGSQKMNLLEALIDDLIIIEVRYREIVRLYAEIETFSNRTNPNNKVTGSAITMGKNDIWIAATTVLTKSALITSDNDFNHLENTFFEVLRYGSQD